MRHAGVGDPGDGTEQHCSREGHGRAWIGNASQRLQDDDRRESGNEHYVRRGGSSFSRQPGQCLGAGEHGGRHEHDRESEKHDVEAGRVARREELGVASEQIEERLRQRKRAQPGQVQSPDES
jgi:hypothetical protein